MKTNFSSEKCPVCESGEWQPKSDDVHLFRHGRKTHQVTELHYAICNKCGTRGYLPGQRKANRLLIQKYQETLRGYVSPSDVLAVREKYLLTQKQGNEIFGGGTQGFSKWERGLTSPAGTTARLIKLALKYPEVMDALAKEAGVELVEPIVTRKASHVVVVSQRSAQQLCDIDVNFTSNDSSFEVEQDDDLWPVAEKTQYQARAYLH